MWIGAYDLVMLSVQNSDIVRFTRHHYILYSLYKLYRKQKNEANLIEAYLFNKARDINKKIKIKFTQ